MFRCLHCDIQRQSLFYEFFWLNFTERGADDIHFGLKIKPSDLSLMIDTSELMEKWAYRRCADTAQRFTIVSGTVAEVNATTLNQAKQTFTMKS
jgi:hypothetical protein